MSLLFSAHRLCNSHRISSQGKCASRVFWSTLLFGVARFTNSYFVLDTVIFATDFIEYAFVGVSPVAKFMGGEYSNQSRNTIY